MTDIKDLTRTEAALAAWDKHNDNPPSLDPDTETNASWTKWLTELESLGENVGRHFGFDTADRNNLHDCSQLIRPNKWLRDLIADWRSRTAIKTFKLRVVQQVDHVYDIEIQATSLDEAMEIYADKGVEEFEESENKMIGGCNHESVEERK